jgi:leucyl-tRNA synthetase
MKNYDHKKIEKKWRKVWDEKKVYKTLNAAMAKAKKMKPYYVLDMFPYPSGAGLHVGHPRGYIASDVFARMKRMQGYNVLHPMGFDSFGLPAEQYAIQTGKNPGPFTEQLVKRYKEQLSILGFSYDWDRQVATHDPAFYKWTQWIFIQLYNSYYDTEKNKARPIAELVKKFEKQDKTWKKLSEIEQQNILMKYRLAYEGYAEVNWCEEMGTVLANDEIIEKDGKMVSERGEYPVVKKQMRQWFMRITAYADRLLAGLNDIDWPENIKEIQRNWIGKSEGSEIDFAVKDFKGKITVFTTRADTLFGVTYVVLAPEHEMVQQLKPQIKNWSEVEKYIAGVKAKSDEDRVAAKEKTGVELQGVFAINPANGEQVPVWIADYVLASYGTGAVMAVPAHDERDFEFANKYGLPLKQVVVPENRYKSIVVATTLDNAETFKQELKRKGILFTLATSSISGREHIRVELTKHQLHDFTGLVQKDIKEGNWVEILGSESIVVLKHGVFNDLLDRADDWFAKFAEWEPHVRGQKNFWDMISKNPFLNEFICYREEGLLRNSGDFDGMSSAEARKAITEFVGGKLVTKYKMRDAIFARQRYWGEPIPLVHDKDGIIKTIPEKNLPLKLPNVKSYAPTGTGESPLASVSAWVKAGYETNTMPGWAGSSWYFLRYTDPKNNKAFAGKKELDYWFGSPSSRGGRSADRPAGGVNMYVGGSEHATGHLLYSRFWHKALKDLGHVKTEEPFAALRNQGMIGGADGRKMSKRWGNVVNPDDVVRDLGADTMRVYEAFMGPFESHLPWSTDGIVGSRRFIERVWRLQDSLIPVSSLEVSKALHKMIKKVSDDIPSFGFNTAVSAMMIFVNVVEKAGGISAKDFKQFLQVLAPFAPHVTEELWNMLGEKKSIHRSEWPAYNPKLIVEDTVTLGVQVNGKVRAEITISVDADEASVRTAVLALDEVKKWIDGKEIKKFIYVPKKIISVVI